LENWNLGIMGKEIFSVTQYSSTPSFHHSIKITIWMKG
jgi:hypothetical protein